MTTDLVITNPWKNTNMTPKADNLRNNNTSKNDMLAEKLDIAKSDIGECEKIKQQCLNQLKEWVVQNGDIENCLLDDNFLLRFLRTKKYSLFMAQQMILKYLNFRKKFNRFMDVLDFKETKADELISNGYIFASPFRDSEGRRVIIYNIGKFDLDKYTNVDMGRVHSITYEAVVEDEETQLLGVNHIADLAGVSAAFTTLFSITEFTRLITWGEQSVPMRHKEINLLSVPTALKYVYEYALSKMSKKLTERFTIHDSLTNLLDKIDKNCLPLEMGGVMPKADMIHLWKKELSEKRDRLLRLTEINLLSDSGILSSKNIGEHMANAAMEGLPGSFRKLEVD